MPATGRLRIGTRASKLARWQSDWTAAQLANRGVDVEVVEISTQGDVLQQGSVASLGVQGIFTKEIQAALLAGEVDVAVHSLKDLPTQQIEGLTLAAVPPRENPADALAAAKGTTLESLPRGARVGTGSLRRRAQLLHLRPDLEVRGIRGNVDTRLRKLDAGEYDAIVLAAAGLTRLGWQQRIVDLLEAPRMLPAPGQGALAIECRADDAGTLGALAPLDDWKTRLGVVAERTLLEELHGGCSAPIAAWGRVIEPHLAISALVASLDGRLVLRAQNLALLPQRKDFNEQVAAAEAIGRGVAEDLLRQGAGELIAAARQM